MSDYRDFLREYLARHDLSQSVLADRMGMSRSWASQILNGHRGLRPVLAGAVADALAMKARDRMRLLALVEREESNSELAQARAEHLIDGIERSEPGNFTTPRSDLHQVLARWQAGAIYEMARCEQVVPDLKWIADMLQPRQDLATVKQAIQALQAHGLLDEQLQAIPMPKPDMSSERQIAHGPDSDAAYALHEETLELAKYGLRTTLPSERLFVTASLALSEADFDRFRERFEELVADLTFGAATPGVPPNRVYQVNVAVYPITLYTDIEGDPSEHG
ncbi:MAG: TIGR02147 family protein [Myxococcota bacterium]